MRKRHHKVVIVGGGITGLWLAKCLTEANVDFLLISSDLNGGLLAQVKIGGFTFDSSGGHVYGVNDERVSSLMSKIDSTRLVRKAYYRHGDQFVDYPVQDHAEDIGSQVVSESTKPEYRLQSLEHYATPIFGKRFMADFFSPFNGRVWKTPLYQMDSDWTEGRVKVTPKTDSNWGSNSQFFYAPGPMMFEEIKKSIDPNRLVEDVVLFPDISNKKLTLLTGEDVSYETLVWTPSLKFLMPQINESHSQLVTTRVLNICVGLNRRLEEFDDFHWFYPDVRTSDYHRVNKLSNYHSSLVPLGCDSLMLEQTFKTVHPLLKNPLYSPKDVKQQGSWIRSSQVDKRLIVSQLAEVGIPSIKESDIQESIVMETPGYPVPTLGIRSEVARIKLELMKSAVLPAGRFGSHAYFNIDHCMTEAETIRNILVDGKPSDIHDYLYSSMYYSVYKNGKKPEDYLK